MYEGYQVLTVERRDAVLRVAMGEGSELDAELARVFVEAQADEAVRIVVLTGAAEKAFCVGGGGKSAPTDEAGRNAYWLRGIVDARDIILSALACDKPVVGRINGHAVGKGCSIALCCDVTVVVDDAKIGDTHVKIGLAAGDGGSLFWPILVGPVLARRYLLTGDLMSGREAAAIGLMTEAVPRADLDARVDEWVARLQRNAPLAVTHTKRAINAAIRREAMEHMDLSLGLETQTYMTQDYREGVTAMVERREPRFQGR